MRILLVLSLAVIGSSLSAQSNTVPGLDGRLATISNLTDYGRRGLAHPNGEVGMAMLNDMCNPGSINIPWSQAMQPNHPKFGFMIARIANDRIEQINEWSFCKHAYASINIDGACGQCVDPGTMQLMGLNCSDAYGANSNANRTWLGPPHELNPWLGTWNPVGSYFDIGDPSQAGYPLPADGTRSLSTSVFDSIDNRVTVDEIDLTTPGASYYYGLHLMHEGESLANRGDNNGHRGFNPSWDGSQWSYANNAESFQHGSILDRWAGAMVESAHNGNDDGRFYVASKTTNLGGGLHHYEYAIHNIDNSRAGGTLRIPIHATATASNFSFGDIDTNSSNDWSVTRVGNEIVFTSTPSNALEWNTIYNFGFDANFVPGVSLCKIDQARPGPGALHVEVAAKVPSDTTLATFTKFGDGCPGTVALPPTPCTALNPGGGTLSNQTNQYEYTLRAINNNPVQVLSFDIFTASNSGTIVRPAHIYQDVGGQPSSTPLASTTITVSTTPGFYTATFSNPVAVNGTFYVGYENSPSGIIPNLTVGDNGVGFYRTAVTGSWNQSSLVDVPCFRVFCNDAPSFATPAIGNIGLAYLGASYDVTLDDALASSVGVLASGLSNTSHQGSPLPVTLPGAPGCSVLVAPQVLQAVTTSSNGQASSPILVPNSSALVGLAVYHQWAVLDSAANGLGIAMSDGGQVTVGN
jgi:hypothetical protein